MQLPLQVVFRNMEHSAEIEELIRAKATKLETFADRIVSCRVLVEVPHRHHQQGNHYHVTVDVTLPGCELVVRRDPADRIEHKDIRSALRDAFDSAKRQVEEFVRQRRDRRPDDGVTL